MTTIGAERLCICTLTKTHTGRQETARDAKRRTMRTTTFAQCIHTFAAPSLSLSLSYHTSKVPFAINRCSNLGVVDPPCVPGLYRSFCLDRLGSRDSLPTKIRSRCVPWIQKQRETRRPTRGMENHLFCLWPPFSFDLSRDSCHNNHSRRRLTLPDSTPLHSNTLNTTSEQTRHQQNCSSPVFTTMMTLLGRTPHKPNNGLVHTD